MILGGKTAIKSSAGKRNEVVFSRFFIKQTGNSAPRRRQACRPRKPSVVIMPAQPSISLLIGIGQKDNRQIDALVCKNRQKVQEAERAHWQRAQFRRAARANDRSMVSQRAMDGIFADTHRNR